MPTWRRLTGLSPRRRTVLICAVALLVVAAVAISASSVLRGRRSVPAPDRPGAVLLVPGYGGDTGGVTALAERIRATSREVVVVTLPAGGTGDLSGQAAALDVAAEDALRAGAPSVDVIGYSAGGVVARLWVQEHDGARKARRVITLGSPHHGTRLAAAGAAAAPGACPVACQQLAPGSRLLTSLETPVPTPPFWLSLWTLDDETVTPPESARLEGALDVPIQSVCPDRRVSHSGLPSDPFVITVVLRAIGPSVPGPPTPDDCLSS